MKNGFYMGYDAAGLDADELLFQARLLLDDGWYTAGYQTICLGCADKALEHAAGILRNIGFQIGISLSDETGIPEAAEQIKAFDARMVTILHSDDNKTEALAASIAPGIRVAIATEEKNLAWAAQLADTVILDALTEDADYFEVTRNQLDSCRDGDTDAAMSAANLRASKLLPGGTYQVGAIPTRFDYYRNEAIFTQICMLGCPLILKGDLSEITADFADLICDEGMIHVAKSGVGGVLRYYDPWHVLMGKADGEKYAYALLLNRCHGDQPTNLLPDDLGWDSRFAIRLWPENELVGANLETYEAHVETSDHPQTPCCRLVRAEKL